VKVGEHMAGQPKKFKKKEFEDFVLEYFDKIYNAQTEDSADIPTFYGFFQYVSKIRPCSFHTVRRCFDEYWADIKKDFEEIRADLLVRGGSLGKYNSTMVIFALKNWCNWADKKEVKNEIDDKANGQLADLINGLKDNVYTKTTPVDGTVADEPTEKN